MKHAALLALLLATPAQAIVGGREGGPIASSTLMVLSDRGGVCTGIVVAPDAVLTAAHCGGNAAGTRIHYKERGEPVLIEPAALVRHPGFDAKAVEARRRSIDLALIRLKEPLPARFVPARLDAGAQPRLGESVIVAGYGTSIEGEATTTGTYRSVSLPVAEPYGPGKVLLWMSGKASGACEGDSGGPTLRGDAVVAVTSWSTGAAGKQCGALTQSVLLAPQRAWIDRVLGQWGARAAWVE